MHAEDVDDDAEKARVAAEDAAVMAEALATAIPAVFVTTSAATVAFLVSAISASRIPSMISFAGQVT